MLKEVLKLISKGFKVFPCKTDKTPAIAGGHNSASDEVAFVEKYWKEKDWSVGVATGFPSGGIVVIDCDNKPEQEIDGLDNFNQYLEEQKIELPETLTSITGGGGTHFFFKSDEDIRCTTNFLGIKGVDIRANGGYVIVPPSPHKSGNCYTWANDFAIASLPKPLEDVLIDYKKKIERAPKEKATNKSTISNKTSKKVFTDKYSNMLSIDEGERNTTLHKLGSLLLGIGLQYETISEALLSENELRCKPPLDEDDIYRIMEQIQKYKYTPYSTSKINLLFSGIVPATSVAIYFFLWFRALTQKDSVVYIKQEEIGNCLGIKDTLTVRKHAELLEKHGFIDISRANHQSKSGWAVNSYRVL